MLENTIAYGSGIGILLLVYSQNVAIEIAIVYTSRYKILTAPKIVTGTYGTIFAFGSLPCIIWPSIYVYFFDGIYDAVLSWILFQFIGALLTIILRLRGQFLGIHIFFASIALPIGYWLTISTFPT